MKIVPKVKSLTAYHRVADFAMWPLMFALGKFRSDSIQETHPWHIQNIKSELVNTDLSVLVKGQSEAIPSRLGPVFHMFGGWKNYATLQAEPPYHIGWVFFDKGRVKQAAVNRLLIIEKNVRMLAGPNDTKTLFFAVRPTGEQVLLQKIGQGTLGDKRFPNTRLL